LLWQNDIKKIYIINVCIAIYNLQNGAMLKIMLITNQLKIVNETRLEHDDDPPNENNHHETMFGEKTTTH